MEKGSVPEIRATLRLCHSSGEGRSRKAKGAGFEREVMEHSWEREGKKRIEMRGE